MPAANMMESLQPPALQVPEPRGAPRQPGLVSSSTPRFAAALRLRCTGRAGPSLEAGLSGDLPGVLAPGKGIPAAAIHRDHALQRRGHPVVELLHAQRFPAPQTLPPAQVAAGGERKGAAKAGTCRPVHFFPVPPPASPEPPGRGKGQGASRRIAGALLPSGRLAHVSPIFPAQVGPVTLQYVYTGLHAAFQPIGSSQQHE